MLGFLMIFLRTQLCNCILKPLIIYMLDAWFPGDIFKNWHGLVESDCLIKTKHCEGPSGY
jgi:hypothetical protein